MDDSKKYRPETSQNLADTSLIEGNRVTPCPEIPLKEQLCLLAVS